MTSLFHALSVHVEPLAADARVVVIGNAELGLGPALLELGAHSVHVYDPDAARAQRSTVGLPRGVVHRPLEGTIDVRDEAFDVAIVPDVGLLDDAAPIVRDLRRLVTETGAVVALGRARQRASGSEDEPPTAFGDLSEPSLSYDELYELFADVFPSVGMTGVLPFAGVVFAELGVGGDVSVSVDTRLSEARAPDTFVVVASRRQALLDPYAIVQIPELPPAPPSEPVRVAAARDDEAVAAFAAMQLRADTLLTQLEEHRERLALAESRGIELQGRLREALATRDVDVTRFRELEAAVVVAERVIAELEARAKRAEDALALSVIELEDQLRERAGVIADLERELERREHLVKELVATIDEPEERSPAVRFEAVEPPADDDDREDLRAKLDALALDAARREGELVARGWRIAELEQALRRTEAVPSETEGTVLADADTEADAIAREEDDEEEGAAELREQLGRTQDEVDALRQALAQEHASRVAAESGEELLRARAELQEQAVLMGQLEEKLRTLTEASTDL